MKKLLFGISLLIVTWSSAQNFPDNYPTSSDFSTNYGDAEDEYYFPDDYYYEYPDDYYTNDFHENSYNDYRRSVEEVNWNRFFQKYRLNPWQIQQIIRLNERYSSYSSWDYNYRYNPDRWYYDRYFALERILGPRVFVIYQNNYYHGHNPVIYYQNYRRQHYTTNIYVLPRYRKINVVRYKIDRNQFHQNNPRNQFGFRDSPRNANGNWNNSSGTDGFRDSTTSRNGTKNTGFRNGANSSSTNSSTRSQNNGSRNNTNSQAETVNPRNNGFRNNGPTIKSNSSQRKIENNSTIRKSATPRSGSPSTSQRSSGFRLTSR